MPSQDTPVIIIGAGPAGLSTAFWLRQAGYTNVTILEKEQRVGGLCKSLTLDGVSYDLGANFITKAYTNICAMADTYGASMYSEKPFYVMEAPPVEDGTPPEPVSYSSLFNYVRQHDDGTTTNACVFTLATLAYAWKRWRLASLLDKPTFEGVAAHPELCVPFSEWLKAQKFLGKDLHHYLYRLFQVPITMMGYGQLEDTAAPYALKFMTNKTFIPMCLKAVPVIGQYLTPWPKRFDQGFQRFWERVSWDFDVRTGIHIQRIDRSDPNHIVITYTQIDQDFYEEGREPGVIACGALILACPLAADYLDASQGGMLTLSEAEKTLFGDITSYNYCMTTYQIDNLGGGLDAAMGASAPLMCVFPENDQTIGRPWAIAQANEDVDFVQFYSRINLPPDTPLAEVRAAVNKGCAQILTQMTIDSSSPPKAETPDESWHTFDRWNYFQHVSSDVFAGGWYDRLATLQGQQNTYYAGGATNFELIEPITAFAKDLVQTKFPGDTIDYPPGCLAQLWTCIKKTFVVVACLLLAAIVAFLLYILIVPPPDAIYMELPLSDQTPEADVASHAYWEAFHGNDYSKVDDVISKLETAIAKDKDDQVISTLLGAAHLWKYIERRQVGGKAEDFADNLPATMKYADMALAQHDSPTQSEGNEVFSTAMHNIAQWEIAQLERAHGPTAPPEAPDPAPDAATTTPQEVAQAVAAMHAAIDGDGTTVFPIAERTEDKALIGLLTEAIEDQQFASFVLSWVTSATVGVDEKDFQYGQMGIDEMMNACAGFTVPEDLLFNDPILSFMAVVARMGDQRRKCYNNPMAPHNLEGYFMSAGDVEVKKGDFKLAMINYENATRMPRYDTWPFRAELEWRMTTDLNELRDTFREQSRTLNIPEGEPAMTFYSGHGCTYCHAQ